MVNPNIDIECIKKGLIMSNVQSGKTANYIALINKVADVGYKLIIHMAGTHNNVRMQTQYRINNGFIGFDEIQKTEVGVSKYESKHRPFSFTSTKHDFKKDVVIALTFDPENSKVPVILVIKKIHQHSKIYWDG